MSLFVWVLVFNLKLFLQPSLSTPLEGLSSRFVLFFVVDWCVCVCVFYVPFFL